MELLFAPIIFVIVGLVMVYIGFYLMKSQKIEIINMVDHKKAYNRAGLSKFAGKNAIYMGAIIVLLGILDMYFIIATKNITFFLFSIAVFMGTVLYYSIKTTLGIKRFEEE